MIIVRLRGGLGNQMFEYAYARYLSIKYDTEVCLDLSFLNANITGIVKRELDLDIFNVHYKIAEQKDISRFVRPDTSVLNRAINKYRQYVTGTYVRQKQAHDFDRRFLDPGGDVYLDGHWGSYRFFQSIHDVILKEFTLKEPSLPGPVHLLLQEIQQTNSVCVNVRRADFVNNSYHICYGSDYFRQAKKIMETKADRLRYFVFSDDIPWCRENLDFLEQAVFVEHDYAGKRFEYYLELMRHCRHFIIPNSTFAWWAAWLNGSADKTVIAPRKWYARYDFPIHDLCPETWILI